MKVAEEHFKKINNSEKRIPYIHETTYTYIFTHRTFREQKRIPLNYHIAETNISKRIFKKNFPDKREGKTNEKWERKKNTLWYW